MVLSNRWRVVALSGFVGTLVLLTLGSSRDNRLKAIINYHPTDDGVTLRVENAPLSSILQTIAKRGNFEVQVVEEVGREIFTGELSALNPEDLIRKLSDNYSLVFEQTDDGVQLVRARLDVSEKALPKPGETMQAADQGERNRPGPRVAAQRIHSQFGHQDQRTPAEVGILSNSIRSMYDLVGRGGVPSIHMANAILDTRALLDEGKALPVPGRWRAGEDTQLVIVQFEKSITSENRADLETVGVQVAHYLPKNAFAVYLHDVPRDRLMKLKGILHVEPYHPYFKMSASVLDHFVGENDGALSVGQYNLLMRGDADIGGVLAGAGVDLVKTSMVNQSRPVVTVDAQTDQLEALLHHDAVFWLEPNPVLVPLNDLGHAKTRATEFRKIHPTLDGEGITIGVTDTGLDVTHRAFAIDPTLTTDYENPIGGINSRVLAYTNRPSLTTDGIIGDTDGHGTHVAGILLGNGALSDTAVDVPGSGDAPYGPAQFEGIISEANLVVIEDFNSFTAEEQVEFAWDNGVRLSNNSWGSVTSEYGTLSMSWDLLVRDAKPLVPGDQEFVAFFAAGNDGAGGNEGLGGTAGTILAPGNAKNVITVGAVEQPRFANNLPGLDMFYENDSDNQVAPFSARGPVSTTDPRVKPDIVAPGTYVISAQSRDVDLDNFTDPDKLERDLRNGEVDTGPNYSFLSGTSMATPMATGAGALIYEHWLETRGVAPSPALVKAILVSGAKNLNSMVYQFAPLETAPTLVHQGWGELDLVHSIEGAPIPDQKLFFADQDNASPLNTSNRWARTVSLGPNVGGMKITLAWTDVAGTPGAGSQLVNDLDLVLRASDGSGWFGNYFAADGLHSEKIDPEDLFPLTLDEMNEQLGDHVNNVEIIQVPDLPPGVYTVEVLGYNVPSGPQDFALVINEGGEGIVGHTVGSSADMALDYNDVPVVAFQANDSGGFSQIFVKRWKGTVPLDDEALGEWTKMEDQWVGIAGSFSATGVSQTVDPSEEPAIALHNDKIYVVWQQQSTVEDPPSTNIPSSIYLRHFDGTQWLEMDGSARGSGISGNTTTNNHANHPAIDVGPDGLPVVVWSQEDGMGTTNIFLVKWNGVDGWEGLGESDISGIPGSVNSARADVAVDSQNNIVVVWEELSNARVRASRWAGFSWEELPDIGIAPNAQQPDVAISPLDVPWVVYQQYPDFFADQYYAQVLVAKYDGENWVGHSGSYSYPGISDSLGTDTTPIVPRIDINDDGQTMVCWQETVFTNNSIIVKVAEDGEWEGVSGAGSTPGIVERSGFSVDPIIKVDSIGVPVVVWQNDQHGPQEVLSYTLTSDRVIPAFDGLGSAIGGTNGNVLLAWAPAYDSSAPVTYTVYQSSSMFPCGTDPGCDPEDVFSSPVATTTGLTFEVTGLMTEQVYCFGVRSTDSTGLMEANNVVRSAGPISGTGDIDTDCLANVVEIETGTEVCIPDTDDDGMGDGWEWAFSTANPAHANALAMDPLDNGLDKVRTEIVNDGDFSQFPDEDLDSDGASNYEEFAWWLTNNANCDIVANSPDPTNPDTDGDMIPDGWEIVNGLDPTDPADALEDPEGDGLDNLGEWNEGGDPFNPDSDGDGINDGLEVTNGSRVGLADTDQDGLDDGFEAQLGTDPINWDSNGNNLGDGDIYQLGFDDPAGAITNWVIYGEWDFESEASRADWASAAPNPVAPFNLWHASTADPDPAESGDGILTSNERTATTSFRVANDSTGSDPDATYNLANLKIICELISPVVDCSGSANLFVEWNEYLDTEKNADLTRVYAVSGGGVNWVPISTEASGVGTGWVHRTADLGAFAGVADLQVRFLFQTLNSVNQNFKGWYVDDVKIVEGFSLVEGWVRDTEGLPIHDAEVSLIGRGGVTNIVNGHMMVLPGKIFAQTSTTEDGSYRIQNMPRGHYYLKADSPIHKAEFWNGPLLVDGVYAFGNHLNPGVQHRDLVSASGVLDLSTPEANGVAQFELERGSSRSCLGVGADTEVPVVLNDLPAMVWNGDNVGDTSAFVPYQANSSNSFANVEPDWVSNSVMPNLLSDLHRGKHVVRVEGLDVLVPLSEIEVREGETTIISIRSDQASSRLFVRTENNDSLGIVLDGVDTGLTTPALLPIRAGRHVVRLVSPDPKVFNSQTELVGLIGQRTNLIVSTEALAAEAGALNVEVLDPFGYTVTGAVVYVDGVLIESNHVSAGITPGSPTRVEGLKPGHHSVRVELDGYQTVPPQAVPVGAGVTGTTEFVIFQSDRDYDLVGDRTEILGYTNILAYARDDDPDGDGASNKVEFDLFQAHNIVLDIFNPDTDGDLMTDGEELGYDGVVESLSLSTLSTNASDQAPEVFVNFSGSYLDGIDFFETGHYIASIECDRFDAGSLDHSAPLAPTTEVALTVLSGIPSAVETMRVSPSHNVGSLIFSDTMPDSVDTDGDSMWDGFEALYGANTIAMLDPIECGLGSDDPDGDGLSNLDEFLGVDGIANTNDFLNPTNSDTDNDFMPDGYEIEFGFDPLNPSDNALDPDLDGLSNLGEWVFGSNPLLADTDGDFLPDGAESDFGSDPHSIDTDGDGLIDGREVWDRDLDGAFDGGFFNILPGEDFDGDGQPDGPADFDSDGDGMPDGFEVIDPFGNLLVPPPGCAMDPLNPNDVTLDCDEDGLSNLEEYLILDAQFGNHPSVFNAEFPDVVWDLPTNPYLSDTDGDALPDGWEALNGLHPYDPVPDRTGEDNTRYGGAGPTSLGPFGDPDQDGLWNLREFRIRFSLETNAHPVALIDSSTHPWDPDSDDDGLKDGEEDRSFRTHPLLQDTDGDRLMDGGAVDNTFAEVDTTPRADAGVSEATNHYDQALNDLWILDYDLELEYPFWTQAEVDTTVEKVETLDQQQVDFDQQPMEALGLAQSFTAEKDGLLTKISIQAGDFYAQGSNTVTIVEGGDPDGTHSIATQTFTMAALVPEWSDIVFDDPPVVVAGEQYTFVFQCCGNGMQINLDSNNAYEGGSAYYFDPVAGRFQEALSGDGDYVFETYVTGDLDIVGNALPETRWGQAMTYIPVFEVKNARSDHKDDEDPPGVILLDNRKLVVMGGRDGVGRFTNIWEYHVRDNTWSESIVGIELHPDNGISELQAVPWYGYRNTKDDACPCEDVDYECDGTGAGEPKNRPYSDSGSFDWTYIFGGWDASNQYFGAEFDSFYKSTDDQRPVVDISVVTADVWQAESSNNVTVAGGAPQETLTSEVYTNAPAAGAGLLPLGCYEEIGSRVETNEAGAVSTVDYHRSWQALGMNFPEFTMTPNCDVFIGATAFFGVVQGPAETNLEFEISMEFTTAEGASSEQYIVQEGTAPLDRINLLGFTAEGVVTGVVEAGFSGNLEVDITPIAENIINDPAFSGGAVGLVITATSACPEYAFIREGATEIHLGYKPSYKIDPFWEAPDTVTISGGTNANAMAFSRKSFGLVKDIDRQVMVLFGGINGNEVLNNTFEGTVAFLEEDFHPDAVTFTEVFSTNIPPARYDHSMVYDTLSDRVIMFGGFDSDHQPLNDLWAYSGEQWTEITDFEDNERPPPRGGASMVWFGGADYTRGVSGYVAEEPNILVLFGGTDGEYMMSDTWWYDSGAADDTTDGGDEDDTTSTTGSGGKWRMLEPHGEHSHGPTPRAFASLVYAQNGQEAPDVEGMSAYLSTHDAETAPADSVCFLFGGRSGTLPTGRDTDDDKIEDGVEHALGGPIVGRNPNVNSLIETNHLTELPAYVYKRIGSIPPSGGEGEEALPIGAIADFEALSPDDANFGLLLDIPVQSFEFSGPDRTEVITGAAPTEAGIEAFHRENLGLWFHQHGGENPYSPLDVWERGCPDSSLAGTVAVPPYAHRGRWVWGTDLDSVYPNNAHMELYSGLISLDIPCTNCTEVVSSKYILVFNEWLDLADENDIVRVDIVRPKTLSDFNNRRSNPAFPPRQVVEDRNSSFNTAGAWREVSQPLDILGAETNIFFRFSLISDSSGVAGGWYIDDLRILQGAEVVGVVSNDLGAGLSGVQVQLLGTNINNVVLDSTFTGSDGGYQFGALPFGCYQVGFAGTLLNVCLDPVNGVVAGFQTVLSLEISGLIVVGPGMITWPAVPGLQYRVEFADSLMGEATVWSELGTFTATSTLESFTDPIGVVDGEGFYRVVQVVP